MYFEIHAEIASVRIRKQVRADGRMIQSGIENGFIFFIGSGDVYFRQIIIPGSAGIFSYLVEVPLGDFLRKVGCNFLFNVKFKYRFQKNVTNRL